VVLAVVGQAASLDALTLTTAVAGPGSDEGFRSSFLSSMVFAQARQSNELMALSFTCTHTHK
jgi:hypothetical protein